MENAVKAKNQIEHFAIVVPYRVARATKNHGNVIKLFELTINEKFNNLRRRRQNDQRSRDNTIEFVAFGSG